MAVFDEEIVEDAEKILLNKQLMEALVKTKRDNPSMFVSGWEESESDQGNSSSVSAIAQSNFFLKQGLNTNGFPKVTQGSHTCPTEVGSDCMESTFRNFRSSRH